jgi:hypothetical protein
MSVPFPVRSRIMLGLQPESVSLLIQVKAGTLL